jgi:hypothetical protein
MHHSWQVGRQRSIFPNQASLKSLRAPVLSRKGCAAVKQRMRSVTNIQKITKAMKMVAASKLRVAQAATFESRGIVQPIIKLLGEFPGTSLACKGQDGCHWKSSCHDSAALPNCLTEAEATVALTVVLYWPSCLIYPKDVNCQLQLRTWRRIWRWQ